MLERLVWLGHDAFLYLGPPTLYVDPISVEDDPPAELILITHGHYDHCSPADIAKICTPETVVICPPDCAPCLRSLAGELKLLEAGARVCLLGLEIEAMPAYTRRTRLHGRANGWLGYRIKNGGERWYHAGDTDYIAEMRGLRADVACLPVSGRTVMSPLEAAAAAECIGPGVALPMHYGTFVGGVKDAERFRERTSVPVRILESRVPAA